MRLVKISLMALLAVGCGDDRQVEQLETVEASLRPIRRVLVESGSIQARKVFEVYAGTNGTVAWIADEGTEVGPGDVVARIDPSGVESRIAQKERDRVALVEAVDAAKAALDRMVEGHKVNLRQARVELADAELGFEEIRGRPKPEEKARAEQALRTAELRLKTARSEHADHVKWLAEGAVSALTVEQKALALASAEVDYSVARRAMEALTSPSPLPLDAAQARLELRRMDLERTEKDGAANIEIARRELEVQNATLAKFDRELEDIRRERERCVVRVGADVRGKVALVNIWKGSDTTMSPLRVGEEVRANRLMFKIADTSTLRVEIVLNEADALQAREGAPVRVTLAAHPGFELQGRLAQIAAVAKDKNRLRGGLALDHFGEADVAGVLAYVELNLTDAERDKVQLGFTARAEIEWEVTSPVLTIPVSAVWMGYDRTNRPNVKNETTPTEAADDHFRASCVVTTSGRLALRQIRIGRRNEDWAEITDGLSVGERVARHAFDAIRTAGESP